MSRFFIGTFAFCISISVHSSYWQWNDRPFQHSPANKTAPTVPEEKIQVREKTSAEIEEEEIKKAEEQFNKILQADWSMKD
jgi:hypothetical protein